MRKIIAEHLAPRELWQEASAAGHPDLGSIQLHSQACFTMLVQATAKRTSSSSLPPPSRLDVAAVAAAATPPLPEPQASPAVSRLLALAAALASLFGAALL
jgi:predicted component of type VI protein secretion system